MSTRPDSLDQPIDPDRVFYELGIMLDKEDFRAEQDYHRGRLARALAFLHGSGTIAGLRVRVPPPPDAAPPDPVNEEVHVEPGLALDRIGRLIELPTRKVARAGYCVRLKKWLDFEDPKDPADETREAPLDDPDRLERRDRLRKAYHPTSESDETPPVPGRLIIDVFLRFAACDRGKTPAFATGPFDALDAVQPSRIRDGFELRLVPRGETDPPLPVDYWAPAGEVPRGERRARLRQLIFGAWDQFRPRDENDPAGNDPVVPDWFDPRNTKHWLFLARLEIPCIDGGIDRPAVRDVTRRVEVHNERRSFVYSAAALAQLLL